MYLEKRYKLIVVVLQPYLWDGSCLDIEWGENIFSMGISVSHTPNHPLVWKENWLETRIQNRELASALVTWSGDLERKWLEEQS